MDFGLTSHCALPARPGCLRFTPLRRPIFRRRQTSALVASRRAAVSWAVSQRGSLLDILIHPPRFAGGGWFTLAVALYFWQWKKGTGPEEKRLRRPRTKITPSLAARVSHSSQQNPHSFMKEQPGANLRSACLALQGN